MVSLITVMNITGSFPKLITVYVLELAFYTIGAFIFMFFYWKKSLQWRYESHSHSSSKFLEHDVALHSIMLTNLDETIP